MKTLLAIYDTVDDATETVAEITRRGITPAACEMFDGWTIARGRRIRPRGFPLGRRRRAADRCGRAARSRPNRRPRKSPTFAGCITRAEVRVARDAAERDLLWKGRKNAFGAVGRISPSYYAQDGVIPRTKLPVTLRRIEEIGKKYGFEIGNIFHAGDGNLHPIYSVRRARPNQFAEGHRRRGRNHPLLHRVWAARSPASTASEWKRIS